MSSDEIRDFMDEQMPEKVNQGVQTKIKRYTKPSCLRLYD